MMISRMNSTYNDINTKIQQPLDSGSKNLQIQLRSEQRRLKEIDSDRKMDEGQKAKEKSKIQQQIDELSRKLKMEQLEKETGTQKPDTLQEDAKDVQKEDTEKNSESIYGKGKKAEENLKAEAEKEKAEIEDKKEKKSEFEKQVEETKKEEEKSKQEKNGISPKELHQMLSADYELLRERILSNVSDEEEGAEDVLKAEIKSDAIYGTVNEAKKEELQQMREKKKVQIDITEPKEQKAVQKSTSGMKVIIKEDSIV